MLTKKYGVGGEISFLPAKGNYGPLLFRETFFDVNGILAPVHEKRVMVKLMGGIGIAKTGFSINEGGCVGSVVCTNQVVPVGSATHFQLHGAAGVEFMVTQNLFVRPQFDVRYIPSLTDQFGSDFVPGGMLWIGFRLGGH
jgi:opacity protein-like surface antigen